MLKKTTSILASLILILSFSAPTFAETSDWIDDSKASAYLKSMARKGKIATKVKCRNDRTRTSRDTQYVELKFTFKNANQVSAKGWAWALTGNMTKISREWKAKGIKIVSRGSFTSKHGSLIVRCVLGHA